MLCKPITLNVFRVSAKFPPIRQVLWRKLVSHYCIISFGLSANFPPSGLADWRKVRKMFVFSLLDFPPLAEPHPVHHPPI